jgi:competence protein ComEA
VIVEDGQRIYIPTRNELFELSVDEYVLGDNFGKADNVGNKVNINTADETELMSLPGIGQAKAKSIIEYRKKNGGFKANDDLMNISGIKERLFSQIEDMITVK